MILIKLFKKNELYYDNYKLVKKEFDRINLNIQKSNILVDPLSKDKNSKIILIEDFKRVMNIKKPTCNAAKEH